MIQNEVDEFDDSDEYQEEAVDPIREELNRLDPKQLIKSYEKEKIRITHLTAQQYINIQKDPQIDLIQPLPKFGDKDEEFKRKIPFLKFADINYISQNLLENTLKSDRPANNNILTNSRSYFKSLHNKSSINKTEQSHSSGSHNFSPREKFNLQLDHNHHAFKHMRQLSKNQAQESVEQAYLLGSALSTKLKKQGNPKVYPTKNNQEEKRSESLKKAAAKMGRRLSPIEAQNDLIKRFGDIQVFSHESEPQEIAPCSREGAQIVTNGARIFVSGGIGVKNKDEVYIADVNKEIYKWNKMILSGEYYKTNHYARIDHSVTFYKGSIYVIGGEHVFDKARGERVKEIANEVRIINTTSGECKTLKFIGVVEGRKAHAAAQIGSKILVFGGINHKNRFLNDLLIFDTVTQRWSIAYLDQNSAFDQGIAHHQMCMFTTSPYRSPELYRKPQEVDKRDIVLEGAYIFGGKKGNDMLYDQLYILETSKMPMCIQEVQNQLGIGPVGRYKHSMTYNDQLKFLIICGGISQDNDFLDDMFVFEIKLQTWIKVQIHGKPFLPRCAHGATVIDTRLYIFGGYSENGFAAQNLVVVEMDQKLAKDLIRDYVPKKASQKQNENQHSSIKEQSKSDIVKQLQFNDGQTKQSRQFKRLNSLIIKNAGVFNLKSHLEINQDKVRAKLLAINELLTKHEYQQQQQEKQLGSPILKKS